MNATRPLRILQVVGNLNRGGTETWLMNVLRQLDRERFRIDFLVHSTNPGAYEDEARALGAGIVTCLHPSRPHVYARNFLRLVRSHGPYDFVHSHMHHYSGFVLRLARRAGIGGRIAHSHSDTSRIEQEARPARKLYYTVARRWIRRNATLGLAASVPAAAALFGADWQARRRCEVLHCGIDLKPFQTPIDRCAVRDELGVPRDALVIGHVGRLVPVKNHEFLLDVAAALAVRVANLHVVLVGEGPLRPALEARVAGSSLAGRVHFTGPRSDVARLLAALDVFVFPSQYEGLGLAVVEAQAAGLPCVVSDAIPEEADAIPRLVRRMGLSQPASAWAEAIRESRTRADGWSRADSCRELSRSGFDIRSSAQRIEERYLGASVRTAQEPVSLP